jgi:hypothetical protein
MTGNARFSDADGLAALGICESLILALTDLKIISEEGARDLLTNVATARSDAAADSQTPEKHQAVVRSFGASSLARTGCGINRFRGLRQMTSAYSGGDCRWSAVQRLGQQ